MKVSNGQDPKQQVARLNEGLRDQVVVKQKELERVKEHWDAKIENEKAVGTEKHLLQHDLNDQKIAQSIKAREERLLEVQNQFKKTQDLLEKEKLTLGQDHQHKMQDLSLVYDDKYKYSFEKAQDQIQQINEHTDTVVKKQRSDADWKVVEAGLQAQDRTTAAVQQTQQKVNDQNFDHSKVLRTTAQTHGVELARLKLEQAQAKEEELKRHDMHLQHYQKQLQSEVAFNDQKHQHLLAQQKEVFETRYNQMVSEHEALMETTKTALAHEMNKLKTDLATRKQQAENKQDDQFYQIGQLNPVVEDMGNAYIITLPLPDYERENLTVVPTGRNLKLSLARKFKDAVTDPDGTENKSSRSEIITKTMQVNDLMNPRTMEQVFQEGVVKIKVEKA